MCEVEMAKTQHTQSYPFQIGLMVYGWAKVRMLEFYYDFMGKFISRDHFQLPWMDTDSMYMAIAGKMFDDIVTPELHAEFATERNSWLVADGDMHNERDSRSLQNRMDWSRHDRSGPKNVLCRC